MTFNFRNALLAGTAIVAVGALAVTKPAYAAGEFLVDANDSGTFTTTAPDERQNSALDLDTGAVSHDIQAAASGSLTFDANTTIGDATLSTAAIQAGANALTVTVTNDVNGDDSDTLTVNGGVSVGSFTSLNLTLVGENTDNVADVSVFDINGNVNLGTGALLIDSGTNANNDMTVRISGNLTAASTTLQADGADTILTFDGSTAQTVSGTINGDTDSAGDDINVANAAGVSFTGIIGGTTAVDTITVAGANTDSSATFLNDVTATAIVLGDGANTNANTVTFNTTGADLDVTGTINGTAGDTDTLIVNGGNSLTAASAIGGVSALDVLTVTGAGTELITQSTLVATDINIAAGSTITAGGNITGDVDFTGAGTLALGDGVDTSATIDNDSGTAGVGTLVITDATGGSNSVVTGNVGATNSLAAINVTGTGVGEFDGTVSATTMTIASTGSLVFDGATVTGNINLAGDGVVDLANTDVVGAINNTSGTAAQGTLIVDSTAGTPSVSGAVGATNTLKLITLNGTGTTAFGSTVAAADITLGGAGTVTFADDVTVTNDIDFANAAGVVTFADGANLTGTIHDTSDDLGIVNFSGSSVVTGNIGTTGASVQDASFNGAAGKTVTVSGTVDVADDIEIDGAGSTTIAGQATVGDDVLFTADGAISFADALVIVGGDIDTATDSQGSVTFGGSGTVTGAIADDTRELKAFTISGTGETVNTGAFQAADTTTLGSNTLNVTGIVDVDAGQTISTTISGPTTIGHIISSGAATVDAASLVVINVDGNGNYVTNNQSFTIIDGTGGTGVADITAANITDTSFLLSFAQDTANDADLVVVATRTSSAAVATTDNNANVAAVLEALGTGGDATLDQVQSNLNAADSAEGVNEVLESLTPTSDGGAVRAGFSTSVRSLDVNSERLASLRDGSGETGMVAGEMGNGLTTWVQGFGQSADQDRRDGIDGYEADTYGLAVGIDTANVLEQGTVGAALSYANTDVDSKNANRTESDVDSYQVSVYGDYDVAPNTYVSGTLAYAWNDISQTRYDVGAISGLNADADYDSSQYIAYLESGYDIAIDDTMTLTPSVLAHYQHISIDDYTETGAGGASLDVDNEDLDILEFGVGAEVSWDLDTGNGSKFRPALNAGYRHDVIGDNVQSTSNFTGGGGSFDTDGLEPAHGTFNVGASLGYALDNNWEFTADYDYEVKSDYDAHSGYVRAGYKF